MRRKRGLQVYNVLDSEANQHSTGGFWFVLQPTRDPVAWKALEHYASLTPNTAQRQALLVWLREHPCPGVPEVEQMEMNLETP